MRQIKSEDLDDLYVQLNWPSRSESTHFLLKDIRTDISIAETNKEGLQVYSFHIYFAKRLGARFTQRSNFIAELEAIVPHFYKEIGQSLYKWQEKAPVIKPEKESPIDVSVDAISEK